MTNNPNVNGNHVQIFSNPQFGKIRTIGTGDQPLFCLKDVCDVLGLKQFRTNDRLSKDVISNQPLNTSGGTQQVIFVNEDGLYDVILDSRKPEAKSFRKWVTSEVLPSLRKQGRYGVENETDKRLNMLEKSMGALLNAMANLTNSFAQVERPSVAAPQPKPTPKAVPSATSKPKPTPQFYHNLQRACQIAGNQTKFAKFAMVSESVIVDFVSLPYKSSLAMRGYIAACAEAVIAANGLPAMPPPKPSRLNREGRLKREAMLVDVCQIKDDVIRERLLNKLTGERRTKA